MLLVLIRIALPGFYGELTKIILQLSSNTLLICSTVGRLPCHILMLGEQEHLPYLC